MLSISFSLSLSFPPGPAALSSQPEGGGGHPEHRVPPLPPCGQGPSRRGRRGRSGPPGTPAGPLTPWQPQVPWEQAASQQEKVSLPTDSPVQSSSSTSVQSYIRSRASMSKAVNSRKVIQKGRLGSLETGQGSQRPRVQRRPGSYSGAGGRDRSWTRGSPRTRAPLRRMKIKGGAGPSPRDFSGQGQAENGDVLYD